MKDNKTLLNLAGDEYWPTISMVAVPGDDAAPTMAEGASQLEGEKTVQLWQRVAILEVTPTAEVYWGFLVGDHAQFMNVPVQLQDGKFGVRVGDGQVRFFIIPKDLKSRLRLKLVETTKINDSKYQELPLY